jgi:hypothetical protein
MMKNAGLLGKSLEWKRDDQIRSSMANNAGFFPADDIHLTKFSERMLEDIKSIDILGQFCAEGEMRLGKYLKGAKTVKLRDLEPFRHEHPWSEVLQNKKVLVIHPFEESIKRQYSRRQCLFKNMRVLPSFELITFKCVQSVAGTRTGFISWFDALDWMCGKIRQINFDVAIIGAGAYGLPLASYIKNIGKKAVHLGGVTQILFGIKGARWDERPFFQQLYNEYWVRPLPEETPEGARKVESGCYW